MKPPSMREQHRLAILRSDKTTLTFLAHVVAWIGNAVAVLWAILFIYSLLVDAGEAKLLLLILAMPVFILWVLGRSMPRFVKWLETR
jgi:hypothetical protein